MDRCLIFFLLFFVRKITVYACECVILFHVRWKICSVICQQDSWKIVKRHQSLVNLFFSEKIAWKPYIFQDFFNNPEHHSGYFTILIISVFNAIWKRYLISPLIDPVN